MRLLLLLFAIPCLPNVPRADQNKWAVDMRDGVTCGPTFIRRMARQFPVLLERTRTIALLAPVWRRS
jgi:hypothetical protein